MARAKAKGIAYKLIKGMPQSLMLETMKKRLCQVSSPVATKIHAATWIHSQPQSANETLQEYIQIFAYLLIHATGIDSTAGFFPSNHILFIKYIFNKEIKKEVAGAKTIQTLRHAMTLAQEAEIKLKKYDRLNDDDPSVMQISSILQSEVMTIQGQNGQSGNQGKKTNAIRPSWKANNVFEVWSVCLR